jgi:hypothetical protein
VIWSAFFLLVKFRQEEKLEIQKLIDFGGFQSPEVRKNNSKTLEISMLGFQCVVK